MPVVQMPDGTQVNMPDHIDSATAARLKAVQERARSDPKTAFASTKAVVTRDAPAQIGDFKVGNHKVSLQSQKEKDVDYDTGLTMIDHMAMAQANNDPEVIKYLGKVYGAANVQRTARGTLVVIKDGKKIAVEGGNKFKNFVADVLGKSPTLAGMSVGAAEGAGLGSVAGPWGAAAAGVGGAIIGGMAGKTVEDLGKMATGRYATSPDEYVNALMKAGIESGEGEMGGRIVTSGVSRILRGRVPTVIGQQTAESNAMTERTLNANAPDRLSFLQQRRTAGQRSDLGYGTRPNPPKPPSDLPKITSPRANLQSAVPGLKHFQWIQTFAEKISGPVPSQNASNSAYIAGRIRKGLLRSGISPEHVDGVLHELSSPDSIPTAEAGELVGKAMQAHKEMLEESVEANLKQVNSEVGRDLVKLDQLTSRYATGDLGVDVAEGIQASQSRFDRQMARVMSKIDSLVGGQQIVPSAPIRQVAESIARRPLQTTGAARELAKTGTPKEVSDPVAKMLKELDVGLPEQPMEDISLADAHRMRSVLRERLADRQPGSVSKDDIQRLLDSVEYSIKQAGANPAAKSAVRLLNKADKAYTSGMSRFQDATMKRMVRDLDAGQPADPEEIARRIIQPGQSARVTQFQKILGPDTWKQVVGADYGRMISAATDETGKVSGVRLLRQVAERGSLMEQVYGKELAASIKELANSVAARDGLLPPEALQPGAIRGTIEALKRSEADFDGFMKKNALSILADPKKNPEEVYNWLVRPNNGSGLKAATKLLGVNSPQMKAVQQTALKELLTNAKRDVASGVRTEALTEALQKYSSEQRKLLFPNGLDEDLGLVGKEITFLLKSLRDESMAGFSAGAVLSPHTPLLIRVPIQVGIGLYANILSRPGTIRYLALGLRAPSGPLRQAAKETLTDLVRYGAVKPDSDQER